VVGDWVSGYSYSWSILGRFRLGQTSNYCDLPDDLYHWNGSAYTFSSPSSKHAHNDDPGPPQELLPSLGLFLTALGLGGMWPCVPTFGAGQFNDTDATEKVQKELYYNWYFVVVNGGFFIASTFLVWVQDNCGWGWGFGIPTLFPATGIAGFLACMKFYRYQKSGGSAITRICQVVVAATRKINVDVPDDSSLLYEMPGSLIELPLSLPLTKHLVIYLVHGSFAQ